MLRAIGAPRPRARRSRGASPPGRPRRAAGTSLLLLFLAQVLGVPIGGHELAGLLIGRELDLDEPAVAVWVVVDDPGLGDRRLVDLDHLPRDRREELRDRLDRLDGAELILGIEDVAHFRKLQINDLAQLFLSMVRDPDRAGLAVDPDPLVARGIAPIFRIHAGTSLALL